MLTLTNLVVFIHDLRMGRYVKTAGINLIISYDPRTVSQVHMVHLLASHVRG